MEIRFYEDHKCTAIWKNQTHIPNVNDKVILKLYPRMKDDEMQWVDYPLSPEENAKKFAYRVKERQWHESDLVVLVVEKLN